MKKLTCLLFAFALMFALAACSKAIPEGSIPATVVFSGGGVTVTAYDLTWQGGAPVLAVQIENNSAEEILVYPHPENLAVNGLALHPSDVDDSATVPPRKAITAEFSLPSPWYSAFGITEAGSVTLQFVASGQDSGYWETGDVYHLETAAAASLPAAPATAFESYTPLLETASFTILYDEAFGLMNYAEKTTSPNFLFVNHTGDLVQLHVPHATVDGEEVKASIWPYIPANSVSVSALSLVIPNAAHLVDEVETATLAVELSAWLEDGDRYDIGAFSLPFEVSAWLSSIHSGSFEWPEGETASTGVIQVYGLDDGIDTLLLEQGGLTISGFGLDQGEQHATLLLTVVNSLEQDIFLRSPTAMVDGFTAPADLEMVIPANGESGQFLIVRHEDLAGFGIEYPTNLAFQLEVFAFGGADEYTPLFITDTIEVESIHNS